MFSFVDMSVNYKYFMLQNILLLKKLHDRGCYRTTKYSDVTLFYLLELLFGIKNISIEETEIIIPEVLKDPEEDSEEEFYLSWFRERPQYIVKIVLPFTCTSAEEETLHSLLQEMVVQGEDIVYMHDMFFLEASIHQKNTVIARFVDYHPCTNIDDEPVDILFTFQKIIEFRDKVVELAAERRRRKNGLHKPQIAC